jgi:hypothetical protein
MEEKRLNWKQIIATAIVTGIVAVVTGLILYAFQNRLPKLTYAISETIPFQGNNETLAIQQVTIRNEGSRSVDSVDCHISVSPAVIKEKRITGALALDYSETLSTNSYKVHFQNLNPNESATISILTSSKTPTVQQPTVTLRAKGVCGKEIVEDGGKKKKWIDNPIIGAIFSAYSVLVALVMMRKRKAFPFKTLNRYMDSDMHSDDQNEIIAYLFNIHDLPEIAETYLKRHRRPSYWSEADHIAATAIHENNPEIAEKRKQILIDLLSYASIAPSSQGIIHYNIARIAKHQGDNAESNKHLDEAEKLIPQLLKKRMKLDPIFKYKKAQQYRDS